MDIYHTVKQWLYPETQDDIQNINNCRTEVIEENLPCLAEEITNEEQKTENTPSTITISTRTISKLKKINTINGSDAGLGTILNTEVKNLEPCNGQYNSMNRSVQESRILNERIQENVVLENTFIKRKQYFTPEHNVTKNGTDMFFIHPERADVLTHQDNEVFQILQKLYSSKNLINSIIANANENQNVIKAVQDEIDKIQFFSEITSAVSSVLETANKGIETILDQKFSKINFQVETFKKQIEEVSNNQQQQSEILEKLKCLRRELKKILVPLHKENQTKELLLKKIKNLIKTLREDQKIINEAYKQLREIRRKIEEDGDSSSTGIKIELDVLQQWVLDKVRNRGNIKAIKKEVDKLETKLNQLLIDEATFKISNICSQLNVMEKRIKTDNFNYNQENMKLILQHLSQCEQELNTIADFKNMNALRKCKELNLNKIKSLTNRIHEDRENFREISNELDQIRMKIENSSRISDNSLFKETKMRLNNIENTSINKIYNTEISSILTTELENCSKILEQTKIAKDEQEETKISCSSSKENKQILNTIHISKIGNGIEQIKKKLEELDIDGFLNELEIPLVSIEFDNSDISKTFSAEIKTCSEILEAKLTKLKSIEGMTKKIVIISSEVNDIEKNITESESITKILKILAQKEKQLLRITVPTNMESIKNLVENRIKKLFNKINGNPRILEEYCKELEEIKRKLEEFTGSSKDTFFNEMEITLENFQDIINDNVGNKKFSKILTKEIQNCTEILEAKLEKLKLMEEVEREILTISSQVDDIEKQLQEDKKITQILESLSRMEVKLFSIAIPSNMASLRKSVINKINTLTDKVMENQETYEKINKKLEKISTKIEEFDGTSEDQVFIDFERKLQNIRNIVDTNIASKYISKILTTRIEKCSSMLESKIKQIKLEEMEENISDIYIRLLRICKQVKENEIFDSEEKITNIFSTLEQNRRELILIVVPRNMSSLEKNKDKAIKLYEFVYKKYNDDCNKYSKFMSELKQIELEIEEFTYSLFNNINEKLSSMEENIPKFYNTHISKMVKTKMEGSWKRLESKCREETTKKISQIQSEVEDIASNIEKNLVPFNQPKITSILKSLKEKQEELDKITIFEIKDTIRKPKDSVANFIIHQIQKLEKNQRVFEECKINTEQVLNETNFELNAPQNLEKAILTSTIIGSKSSELKLTEDEEITDTKQVFENEQIMNEIERVFRKIEIQINDFFGLPTDPEYLKLEAGIGEMLKKLKEMKTTEGTIDLNGRTQNLIDDIQSTLQNLRQQSYYKEKIEKIEKQISQFEQNVDENGQQMSDYDKENIEDELYQIKEKLEILTDFEKLQDRRKSCFERIENLFSALAHQKINDPNEIMKEIESKLAEFQSLIVRCVSTSHSQGITIIDKKLTDTLAKVKSEKSNFGNNIVLQERNAGNMKEDDLIKQGNSQKKHSTTDKINAGKNENEISSNNLLQNRSTTSKEIKFNEEKKLLTDTIKENIDILRQSRQNEEYSPKTGTDTKHLSFKTNQVERNPNQQNIISSNQEDLNEIDDKFTKIQNSVKTFIGSSSSKEFTNLNSEMAEILSKLKQLEISNNREDLQKSYNLSVENILETNSILKNRVADLENLINIENVIAAILKNNQTVTDFEKEDLEQQLRQNIYQLQRMNIDGLEERKNYCLKKIEYILMQL